MAKREKLQKTNAMRELDRAGLAYTVHTYEVDESDLSGTHVASVLGQDPDCVFKTLVTATPEGGHVVCCIPVAEELDLKRAAAAAGEKARRNISATAPGRADRCPSSTAVPASR